MSDFAKANLWWQAPTLYDGFTKNVPSNYGTLGSLPKYRWNQPHVGSQPLVAPVPFGPTWNRLVPTNFLGRGIYAGQLGAYLVPTKVYGQPMEYAAAGPASLSIFKT